MKPSNRRLRTVLIPPVFMPEDALSYPYHGHGLDTKKHGKALIGLIFLLKIIYFCPNRAKQEESNYVPIYIRISNRRPSR